MAIEEIRGYIYQKQGEKVVKILPNTAADLVSCTYGGSGMDVQCALSIIKSTLDNIEGVDAMTFKGIVNKASDLPSSGYAIGDTYKVGTAGTYKGETCEVGDTIFAVATSGANSDWVVLQANIDGAVTGPASASNGGIAVFDGTTGKVIKDSGVTVKTLQDGIAAAQNGVDGLDGRMDTAEADITALEARVTAAEGDIDTLQTDLGTTNTNVTNLTTRVSTAEGNITNLQTNKADKTDLTALTTRVTTAEGNITNLQTNKADKTDLTALTTRVTTAEGNITNNASDIDTLETRAGAIETAATALTDRVETNEDDIADLKARMTTAEKDIDDLEQGLSDLADALAETKWVTYVQASDMAALETTVTTAAAGIENFGLIIADVAIN